MSSNIERLLPCVRQTRHVSQLCRKQPRGVGPVIGPTLWGGNWGTEETEPQDLPCVGTATRITHHFCDKQPEGSYA